MLKTSLQTLKSLPIVTKQQPPRFTKNSVVMEAQSEKVYAYYNHTDSCKFSRWTARESFEFMHARPWQEVVDFYSKSVNGRLSLLELFGTQAHDVHGDDKIEEVSNETALLEGVSNVDKSGRWARVTFKIVLSYHGGSFDGWQKQPGLNTVQGLVEKSLGIFVDEKKAQQLKEKSKPLEGCASVAGRTDKGVSALQQILGEKMLSLMKLKMPSMMWHQEKSGLYPFLRFHVHSILIFLPNGGTICIYFL
uniref:Uncharacterized protein n=1 Tax=Salix viminalis TaxID=40686 RepID=A0A6N2KFP1_SALVM